MAQLERYNRRERQALYKQAVSDYLQSQNWTHFYTITFRSQRRDRLAVLRDVADHFHRIGTYRKSFVAVEPHSSGLGVHVHGLAEFERHPIVRYSDQSTMLWRKSFRRFGRNKFEQLRSLENVSSYCSKYIVKGKEFEYSFDGDKEFWK